MQFEIGDVVAIRDGHSNPGYTFTVLDVQIEDGRRHYYGREYGPALNTDLVLVRRRDESDLIVVSLPSRRDGEPTRYGIVNRRVSVRGLTSRTFATYAEACAARAEWLRHGRFAP